MFNSKTKPKTKHFGSPIIILTVMLIFILSISLALFSFSEEALKMSGKAPSFEITLVKDGSEYNTNLPIVVEDSTEVGNNTLSVGFKVQSNISVYVRTKIIYNWKASNTGEIDYTWGNVTDYITINFVNNSVDKWYSMNGWNYYNANSSTITTLSAGDITTHSIFSSITVNAQLPDDVEIYVLLEVVQGNNLGIQRFGTSGTDYPSAWLL